MSKKQYQQRKGSEPISLKMKIDFLDFFHKHGENMTKACSEFDIARTTGYYIRDDEQALRAEWELEQAKKKTAEKMRDKVIPALEKDLEQFLGDLKKEFDEYWGGMKLAERKRVRAHFLEQLFWKHAKYLDSEIEQLSAKDRYTALGIIEDKLRMLHDEPTQIIQYRNTLLEKLMVILVDKLGEKKAREVAVALEDVDDAEIISEMD